MRVAFYIPVMNVGGAEKVIINLLKVLSSNRDNQYFLITDTEHSSWINEVDSDVTLINVNSHDGLIKRIVGIKSAITYNKIDLVVSHLTHSNIHCLLLKALFQFKLIIVEHNITSDYVNDIPKFSRLFWLLIKRLFKKANKIICVSEATKSDLIKSFDIARELCQVIYNPFDFKKIGELSKCEFSEFILQKLAGRRFIVTVARLEIQKNHIFLIESLQDFLKSEDVCLVLVGGGSQENFIRYKIHEMHLQNHVFLTGYETNPYPYILKADLLVHPARFEGFGLVLVEALYLHTKVVSMNFATAYEILESGKLGIIVDNKITLVQAIESTMNNGFANHYSIDTSISKYKLETIGENYNKIFAEVIS